MEIKVSFANKNDIKNIGEIAYQVGKIHFCEIEDEFAEPTLDDQASYIAESLKEENVKVIKAEINDKIAGYVVLYINTYPEKHFRFPKRGFIGSIGVDENYRGRGVGKSLLSFAEDFLKQEGIKIFEIDVYTFNQHAERLYNNFGFEDIKYYKRKFIK